MSEAATEKGQNNSRVQGARDEKVMIIPDGGRFVVVPPYKVVTPGQTVAFRAFDCDRLDIENLDEKAFDPPKRRGPRMVTVDVKRDAPAGPYDYDAICQVKSRRKRARGNSPPGMIVD